MSSYLLLMIYVCYVDNQLQWNLNRFDLNQDVSFSSEEKTSDQKAALKKVTADNVRNFASITGMILPALFAISTFMLGWLI